VSPGTQGVGRFAVGKDVVSPKPNQDLISKTIKANPNWSTKDKADFIRRVNPTNTGKQWSASAWAAANPGKDVNAATAAATAQGLQVVK